MAGEPEPAVQPPAIAGARAPERPSPTAVAALRAKVQARLLERLAARREQVAPEAEVREVVMEVLGEEGVSPLDQEGLADTITASIVGYGPIQPFLDDPAVTEIMVNGPYQVYIERDGRIEPTSVRFSSAKEVLDLIERIVAPLGRRIDEASPMVDARLPDGSRVNAIIPPVSVTGPALTIRKFSRQPLTAADLVRLGTMDQRICDFLRAAVLARLNMVVSGGTGSGKTTTLNVLSSFIPRHERIITIEDAAELRLQQEHVVSLEARPPNLEGAGEITIRQLVRNALRMRPDRIVVGEVRTGEALDMLQAMNTGHDGSLTTVHANSPRDLLSRLETMVLMAGMDLPLRAVREQIAAALDLIIHQARLKDGTRRITHITEVQGMEGDVIVLQDIFRLEVTGVGPNGRLVAVHRPTGIVPRFWERLAATGVQLPPGLFDPEGGEVS
jgi:pilus assembly protein CpaF